MKSLRIVLYVAVVVLVALLVGYLRGHAGRADAERRVAETQARLDVAEARGSLLAARVDLFEVNFGRASQHLQAARTRLQDAEKRLGEAGRTADVSKLKDVSARVARAQEQAGRLDQSANTGIGQAIVLLEQVDASSPDVRR